MLPSPPTNENGNYKNSTLSDLIQYTTEIQSEYNECAIRNDALVDLILKENIRIREQNKNILK